ncbi:hypothetical protein FALCPG4_007888 [Fusarium falciforme]
MASSHSCCSFTVSAPPTTSDEELPDVAADLCSQCASIDLYALMQKERIGTWYNRYISLEIKMSSPCPLCQFFITTVASKKTLPANPDHELEFELESLQSQLALSLRRLEPGRIDFALIRGWLSYCKAHHKEKCGILKGYPRQLSCLKVIECETGAIIKLPEGSEFAALSYVWGQTQGNGPSTASRAGFLPPHIPKTIRDAIQATIRLNIQYLWVDQYCINQKDKIELGEQIGIMDIVYQVATVTLVAACGEDASFGLLGVSSILRYKQPAIKISGHTWVSTQSTLQSQIISSRWWSRAWTYQEGLFSRRRLYFTDTEIFFECNTICTQEGLVYDLHHLNDLVSDHRSDIHRGAFGYNRGSLDEHIREVTGRQLTH